MATHSSILAWRIPWTEEPGRLWSIGSQSWTTEATEHARLRRCIAYMYHIFFIHSSVDGHLGCSVMTWGGGLREGRRLKMERRYMYIFITDYMYNYD